MTRPADRLNRERLHPPGLPDMPVYEVREVPRHGDHRLGRLVLHFT
jgi:hypothetical protein